MLPTPPVRDRCAVVFLLLLALALAGCAPPGAYVPADHSRNPKWLATSRIIVRLGRIAAPEKPASYWKLAFIRSEKVNAANAGGGEIYVTDGFTNIEPKYQEAILAHELGHDLAGHVAAKRAASIGTSVALTVLGIFVPGAGYLDYAVNPLLVNAYGRAQELEADRLGASILILAHGNVEGVRSLKAFFVERRDAHGEGGGNIFSTHPANTERIEQWDRILAGELIPEAPFASPESKEKIASILRKEGAPAPGR